jgi:hypothetical protein
MNSMNRLQTGLRHTYRAVLVIGVGGALAFSSRAARAVTVFSDDFSASTLNVAPGTPTANSTTYEIASTKTTSSSIAPGHLSIGMASTSSGFVEAQALFSATPVTLATVGDYIEFTLTFTNTTQISGGVNSFLYIGLYNSGGSAPLPGVLTNSALTTASGSPYATGGVQLWQGYVAKPAYSTANGNIVTRPMQNGPGTTSANQDLVANNVGGGAYNNPTGVNLGNTLSSLTLTAGAPYTVQLRLTLSGVNSLDITNLVYDGAGNVVFNQGKVASGANFLTNAFDGLAFGWRFNGTAAASAMDVNSILITTNVIPEPSTSLLVLGGLGLAAMVVRRRN